MSYVKINTILSTKVKNEINFDDVQKLYIINHKFERKFLGVLYIFKCIDFKIE